MNSKSSVAVACFLPGRAKDLTAPLVDLLLYDSSFKPDYHHANMLLFFTSCPLAQPVTAGLGFVLLIMGNEKG